VRHPSVVRLIVASYFVSTGSVTGVVAAVSPEVVAVVTSVTSVVPTVSVVEGAVTPVVEAVVALPVEPDVDGGAVVPVLPALGPSSLEQAARRATAISTQTPARPRMSPPRGLSDTRPTVRGGSGAEYHRSP